MLDERRESHGGEAAVQRGHELKTLDLLVEGEGLEHEEDQQAEKDGGNESPASPQTLHYLKYNSETEGRHFQYLYLRYCFSALDMN